MSHPLIQPHSTHTYLNTSYSYRPRFVSYPGLSWGDFGGAIKLLQLWRKAAEAVETIKTIILRTTVLLTVRRAVAVATTTVWIAAVVANLQILLLRLLQLHNNNNNNNNGNHQFLSVTLAATMRMKMYPSSPCPPPPPHHHHCRNSSNDNHKGKIVSRKMITKKSVKRKRSKYLMR